jgi:hypothetical protein
MARNDRAPLLGSDARVYCSIDCHVRSTLSGRPASSGIRGISSDTNCISVLLMIKEGWQLPYQTPMLGYPWTIPLEFPFYQSIVASITWITGFSLDAVGRLVSFGFLLACAWPAFAIAQRLKLTSAAAWIFCAILWSSPQYLYWGRTFLMETAAVFFTLAARAICARPS